jgi:hypothetical protein
MVNVGVASPAPHNLVSGIARSGHNSQQYEDLVLHLYDSELLGGSLEPRAGKARLLNMMQHQSHVSLQGWHVLNIEVVSHLRNISPTCLPARVDGGSGPRRGSRLAADVAVKGGRGLPRWHTLPYRNSHASLAARACSSDRAALS